MVCSVGCGRNVGLQRQGTSNLLNIHNPNARPCCFMVSCPQSWKPRTSKILASLSSKISLQPLPKQEQEKQKAFFYDKWMRDSVVEIVKKLPESPLLVHVYSGNDTTEIRTERAEEDNWGMVKQKWEKRETPTPDGLIFVEQIEEEESEKTQNEDSRAWGIVVQGKREECGTPACYLLKTSRVDSGCSHFCLVKVQSFRETAFSQLQNCWLLPGN